MVTASRSCSLTRTRTRRGGRAQWFSLAAKRSVRVSTFSLFLHGSLACRLVCSTLTLIPSPPCARFLILVMSAKGAAQAATEVSKYIRYLAPEAKVGMLYMFELEGQEQQQR